MLQRWPVPIMDSDFSSGLEKLQDSETARWSDFQNLIDQCLIKDQFRFRKKLNSWRKRFNSPGILNEAKVEVKPHEVSDWDRFKQAIRTSYLFVENRKALKPILVYPEQLPVVAVKQELIEAIQKHPVVVIAGETGSGKTTQIPKFCLEAGQGVMGRIAHTQPRRIAARSIARRLSQELGSELGQLIGYQVRFEQSISDQNLIRLMTDGFLLSALSRDAFLNEYDTIIIDEAHERSLNIDMLLGILKKLLKKRKNLKVVITSATIDVQRFSAFFDGAPVYEVSGRTYPVDIRFCPPEVWQTAIDGDDVSDTKVGLQEAILYCVQEIYGKRSSAALSGDTLVFLPGEREIREVSQLLRRHGPEFLTVIPLYSRLSQKDQERVFNPKTNERRVILATNVAETSLTVPNIAYVIDSGRVRMSRYSHRLKVQQLPIEPISQASANQRAGRCGRVMEGVCYRLYSEDDFNARPAFTLPEIYRTSLAGVILQMLMLKLGDIRTFSFIDMPESKMISDGFLLLETLSAVQKNISSESAPNFNKKAHVEYRLTQIGKTMARIPVDPKIARLLLAADERDCLSEMLIIASALSVPDVRDRPLAQRQAADAKHAQWRHKKSDFLSDINLWNDLETHRQDLSRRQFHSFCQQHFISYVRWLAWRDLHRQLKTTLQELKLTMNQQPCDYATLHQALLSAFGTQVGMLDDAKQYISTRNRKCWIHPASGLFKAAPKWWLAAQMIETDKLYASKLAVIEPEWVIPWVPHLLKRVDTHPSWKKSAGQATAVRETLLLGLSLKRGEKISLSKTDPGLARELFIQKALVEGELGLKESAENNFLMHNQSLCEELFYLQEKTRRLDIVAPESERVEFFQARIPSKVFDRNSFLNWWKPKLKQQADFLNYQRDWLEKSSGNTHAEQYPDTLTYRGQAFELVYQFSLGSEADGVTLRLPVSWLFMLPKWLPDWVVPGLLVGKCEVLIRGLPKRQRKFWAPVNPFLEQFMSAGFRPDQPLVKALEAFAYSLKGVYAEPFEWPKNIEHQYLMQIEVLNESGQVMGRGYDILELQEKLKENVEMQRVQSNVQGQLTPEGEGGVCYECWPDAELPDRAGNLYPTFKAEENGVRRVDLMDPIEAKQCLFEANAKLYAIQVRPQLKTWKNSLFRSLWAAHWVDCFKKDKNSFWCWLEVLVCKRVFLREAPEIRSKELFLQRYEQYRHELGEGIELVEKVLSEVAGHAYSVQAQWSQFPVNVRQLLSQSCQDDVESQCQALLSLDFLMDSAFWFDRLPSYWRALAYRIEKLAQNSKKDEASTLEILSLWGQYQTKAGMLTQAQMKEARWQELIFWFQELRISLYAQSIKTRFPISVKRLAKQMSGASVN